MGGLIATLRKPLAIARVGRGGGAGPDTVAARHVDSKLRCRAQRPPPPPSPSPSGRRRLAASTAAYAAARQCPPMRPIHKLGVVVACALILWSGISPAEQTEALHAAPVQQQPSSGPLRGRAVAPPSDLHPSHTRFVGP